MWVWLTGETQNELLCYMERERAEGGRGHRVLRGLWPGNNVAHCM